MRSFVNRNFIWALAIWLLLPTKIGADVFAGGRRNRRQAESQGGPSGGGARIDSDQKRSEYAGGANFIQTAGARPQWGLYVSNRTGKRVESAETGWLWEFPFWLGIKNDGILSLASIAITSRKKLLASGFSTFGRGIGGRGGPFVAADPRQAKKPDQDLCTKAGRINGLQKQKGPGSWGKSHGGTDRLWLAFCGNFRRVVDRVRRNLHRTKPDFRTWATADQRNPFSQTRGLWIRISPSEEARAVAQAPDVQSDRTTCLRSRRLEVKTLHIHGR